MRVLGTPQPVAFLFEELLDAKAHASLLTATLECQRDMVESSTGGRDDYRKSHLLYTPPDATSSVLDSLRERVEKIQSALGHSRCDVRDIECQLTAHNHGDFYKAHTDNGSTEAAGRKLSYVYYFNKQPRRFRGGQLVLYAQEQRFTVEANNNRLIVFDSGIEHEVLPVQSTGNFEDSRFSVNGWIWY